MDEDTYSAPKNNNSKPVVVSLQDLETSDVSDDTLEAAFGPSSLGILLVKDLPPEYLELRKSVLSYASYLASLPSGELAFGAQENCPLDSITNPAANYLTGWSHGKESLKHGQFDTMKGSFYANCAFYQGKDLGIDIHPHAQEYPETTATNLWPKPEVLPGFREALERLCTLIIDTAVLVARSCDRYASTFVEDYDLNYLERIVKTSVISKARLLHYFPQEQLQESHGDEDAWCATHIDHGCLTGLTSAMYIDEAANPPIRPSLPTKSALDPLEALPGAPDPSSGLYIHSRDGTVVKVTIPSDHLAFQTGEALQAITQGKFKAVPHFVRAQGRVDPGTKVARNTLAVFTQPDVQDVIDKRTGKTFGQFSKEVMGRFG